MSDEERNIARIVLSERTIAIWFISLDPKSDWMGHLESIEGEDNAYRMTYRFRYYEGDQNLQFEESQDKKAWYELEARNTSKEQVLHDMRDIVTKLAGATVNREYDEILMDEGGLEEFTEALQSRSWTQFERRTYH